MDPQAGERFAPAAVGNLLAEFADQLLDAGINIGAIESNDAGVVERREIIHRRRAIHRPMAAGELPAAADHPRDLIAGP